MCCRIGLACARPPRHVSVSLAPAVRTGEAQVQEVVLQLFSGRN